MLSRKVVEEEVDGGDLAVANDDEIGPGVSGWLARASRHPPYPTAIAHLFGRRERLVLEVRMRRLDHACDVVDHFPASVRAVAFVEHRIFVEDLFDRRTSPH